MVVLQDRPDGVRVDLVGETFISKAGITSTTFGTVPDVPISEFELYLPEGPNSALAANGNLCTAKDLVMPTLFNGQNGGRLKQSTPVRVTGCPQSSQGQGAGGPPRTRRTKSPRRTRRSTESQAGPHSPSRQQEGQLMPTPKLRTRRLSSMALATLGVLAGTRGLAAGPASAVTTHNSLSEITEVPASSKVAVTGPISAPWTSTGLR